MQAHVSRQFFNPPHNSTRQNDTVSSSLQSIGSICAVRCGQKVAGRVDSADSWYRIISGAARRCTIRSDGKRQIVDLLLPGDFFAFTERDAHSFTIEAIAEGTVVACYPRQQLHRLAESDPRIAREIAERALDAMQRLHEHILVLGRTKTREKVASFLLRMAERLPGNRLVLPMSRYDIADYLAISVETVSRSLTGLRQCGVITLCGPRRVSINDRDALEEFGYEDESEPERCKHTRSHDLDHRAGHDEAR
jgi:CRP/FNR family nitrogen fixation transcriptional regulator